METALTMERSIDVARQSAAILLFVFIVLQLSIDVTCTAPLPQFSPTGAQNDYPKELEKVLLSGEKFYLFSLDPELMDYEARQKMMGSGWQFFHQYRVWGSTEIRSMAERRNLVKALCHGVAEGRQSVLSCFNPRHGVRVIQGSRTVDLVICFESWEIDVYGMKNGLFTVTSSPEPVFTAVLKRVNIPVLSPQQCP